MIGDPDTIAIIYRKLGAMGDNGGFDPATVEALKSDYPVYVDMIDAFMRSLSATRLGNLMSGQALMGLKQNDFDTRLCAVEDTTDKTLNYLTKLLGKFEAERDSILERLRDFESQAEARQLESEERAAMRQVRRDKLMMASIPVILALIELVRGLL